EGGGPSTVSNYGTLSGGRYGVRFRTDGGLVVNGAAATTGALITAGYCGVLNYGFLPDPLAVVNYGTISAGWGVEIRSSGGSIANGARDVTTALISGLEVGAAVIGYDSASHPYRPA